MNALLRSPLLLSGLAIRLALLPFFGSFYLRDLFIPFIDAAVLNPGSNPWSLNPPEFFPYGLAQLVILLPLKWLGYAVFGGAALGQTGLSVALMKLAILPFDVLLLRALIGWAPEQRDRVVWLYWLNPIVIYVTYVFGQIDLTSMFFAVSAITALTRGRVGLSALSMAIAMLCKFHVAASVPIFIAYLWNNNFLRPALRKTALWTGILAAVVGAGFLPLLLAGRVSYATATSPEAMRVFSLAVDLGTGQRLYVGVLLVLAVVGRLAVATRITADGLFFGCALIFGSLLLVTNPFPGWYLWVVPFLAVFFATYSSITPVLFALFCALHVGYFAWLWPQAAAGGIVPGLAFTLLQTTLAGILVALYTMVIRHDVPVQGRIQPTWIGIAGDSASGKATLASLLQDLFGPGGSTVVAGDDYHNWERGHAQWDAFTHLDPRANRLMMMAEHTRRLDRGVAVHHPAYDHETGSFTTPRPIRPSRAVIVRGLHTFYLRAMRDAYDLKIFLDPETELRAAWKLRRDSAERGADAAAVHKSLAQREHDARTHISPQRAFADWIIEYHPRVPLTADAIVSATPPPIHVRHIVWNDAPLASVCARLSALPGVTVTCGADADIDRMAFEVEGVVSAAQVAGIAGDLFPTMRHITRTRVPPRFRGGDDGITQLFAIAMLGARRGMTSA